MKPGSRTYEALDQLEYLHGSSDELAALKANVTAATIVAALDDLQPASFETPLVALSDALGLEHPREFLAALLPGVTFPADVGVELVVPEEGWSGDLAIGITEEYEGTRVIVGSPRGAEALGALDRELLAPISTLIVRGHEPPVATFDGVRALELGHSPAALAAEVVLRCASLDRYRGFSASPDLGDALATASVRTVSLEHADAETVRRLGRAQHLRDLSLQRSELDADAIGELAGLPLRKLDVARCELHNSEIIAISSLGKIETVSVGCNSFGDAGGIALARMQIRVLDLSHTYIGNPTAMALAESLELVILDLTATLVGGPGIRALAKAPRLRALTIGMTCPEDVVQAAENLPGVTLTRSDEV